MTRAVGAAAVAVVLGLVLIAAATGGVAASLLGLGGGGSTPSTTAVTDIPPGYLALYDRAAATCPRLDWTVLAGIGKVETDHGRSALPGVHSGANSAGAQGPMQFLPATFAEYDQPVPDGGANPPSPYDPADAIYAAARMLCANGAKNGADLHAAIYAYNHSDSYVSAVLAAAASYSAPAGSNATTQPGGRISSSTWTPAIGQAIADRALTWLGWPYAFAGGNAAGPTFGKAVDYASRNDASVYGFDCSGLVMYALAPWLSVDHSASDQYSQAGSQHPGLDQLLPGDLIFWSDDGTVVGIGHVAVYLGDGQVVQAPHSEAFVEITPLGQVETGYYGATRPLTSSGI
ncbi:MAG: NlpC/P60 family protein [Jatrophihabitantaceae bacterium]